jgi:hypothetical protein
MAKKKLGIIQSRGLGDLIIAIPIAGYFRDQGYDIYWPICDIFLSNVEKNIPWIKWIPVPTDAQGRFFYDIPMERLKNFGVSEIIPLYQHLTGHKFAEEKYFQFTKFDQYKYICSGVPFLNKWRLAEFITRDLEREQKLYDQLVTNDHYVVVHSKGSDFAVNVDYSIIPQGWQTIEITEQTDCIFDWLTILEKAQSLILVDSVFANLVDQLNIGEDRYFIQRSHIGLTPVLGQHWTWLS